METIKQQKELMIENGLNMLKTDLEVVKKAWIYIPNLFFVKEGFREVSADHYCPDTQNIYTSYAKVMSDCNDINDTAWVSSLKDQINQNAMLSNLADMIDSFK